MRRDKWKRHSRARARWEEKARKYWRKYRSHRNRQVSTSSIPPAPIQYQRVAPVKTQIIEAPQIFSLLENFAATNKFFADLLAHLRSTEEKSIFVEMARVNRITIEAVLVLAALINRRKRRGIRITGDQPRDETAAALLLSSGFYDHVQSHMQRGQSDCVGSIVKRKGLRVNTELADQLSQDAQEAISGVRGNLPPAYRILIEAMGNTREHAKAGKRPKSSKTRNVEPWWVMLYADKANKVARFVFYDGGVGVIQSLRPKIQGLIARLTFGPQDTDLIHDMMHGKTMSRTGLLFRGKGLPAMAATLIDLCIID
ncbi:MAG TPA: hypothetical protein VHY09_07565 [Candidatus Methylacidiphilales bacterium]|jgi:hypothetical protein|nr:hypothetical protein [Candidatus Methylacidiphilales bacterium]